MTARARISKMIDKAIAQIDDRSKYIELFMDIKSVRTKNDAARIRQKIEASAVRGQINGSEAKDLLAKLKSKAKDSRAADSLADLHGATPVGGGYVKDNGSGYAVYDSYGNKKGEYATFDEASKAANEL